MASILADRDFATELVEEIEDEVDLIHLGFSGAACLEHGEALAIGVLTDSLGHVSDWFAAN